MSTRLPSEPVTCADLASATAAEILAFAFPAGEPGGDVIQGLLADIERTAALTTIALEVGLDGDVGSALVAIQHRAAAARTLYARAVPRWAARALRGRRRRRARCRKGW